mgnify:FL=1
MSFLAFAQGFSQQVLKNKAVDSISAEENRALYEEQVIKNAKEFTSKKRLFDARTNATETVVETLQNNNITNVNQNLIDKQLNGNFSQVSQNTVVENFMRAKQRREAEPEKYAKYFEESLATFEQPERREAVPRGTTRDGLDRIIFGKGTGVSEEDQQSIRDRSFGPGGVGVGGGGDVGVGGGGDVGVGGGGDVGKPVVPPVPSKTGIPGVDIGKDWQKSFSDLYRNPDESNNIDWKQRAIIFNSVNDIVFSDVFPGMTASEIQTFTQKYRTSTSPISNLTDSLMTEGPYTPETTGAYILNFMNSPIIRDSYKNNLQSIANATMRMTKQALTATITSSTTEQDLKKIQNNFTVTSQVVAETILQNLQDSFKDYASTDTPEFKEVFNEYREMLANVLIEPRLGIRPTDANLISVGLLTPNLGYPDTREEKEEIDPSKEALTNSKNSVITLQKVLDNGSLNLQKSESFFLKALINLEDTPIPKTTSLSVVRGVRQFEDLESQLFGTDNKEKRMIAARQRAYTSVVNTFIKLDKDEGLPFLIEQAPGIETLLQEALKSTPVTSEGKTVSGLLYGGTAKETGFRLDIDGNVYQLEEPSVPENMTKEEIAARQPKPMASNNWLRDTISPENEPSGGPTGGSPSSGSTQQQPSGGPRRASSVRSS